MRTGRNLLVQPVQSRQSLDHWDMRTGRNRAVWVALACASLDHWDMRTGRNPETRMDTGLGV